MMGRHIDSRCHCGRRIMRHSGMCRFPHHSLAPVVVVRAPIVDASLALALAVIARHQQAPRAATPPMQPMLRPAPPDLRTQYAQAETKLQRAHDLAQSALVNCALQLRRQGIPLRDALEHHD
jgi:hypothetical protein